MTESIHQLLAVFDEADAQGHMAVFLQNIFRGWGLDSKIFAGIINPGQKSEVFPADTLETPGDPSEILILHYSISSPVGGLFRRTFRNQVLIYHNVTEADFFRGWDDLTFVECRKGRNALRDYIPTCDLALGVSAFNAAELAALGFERVGVLPFPFDERRLEGPADASLVNTFGKGDRNNLLFVGRLSPNKKQEDVIRVFYYFQKFYNPDSRLFLVGASHIPAYYRALCDFKDRLGLREVYLTGKVTGEELRAYYRIADLFLCLSEHEGFCVPLMECFHYKIPVVAYAAAAVPQTLAGAGILLAEKNPVPTAGLLDRVLKDEKLKKSIIDSQNRRLEQIRDFPFEEKLKEYLRPFF